MKIRSTAAEEFRKDAGTDGNSRRPWHRSRQPCRSAADHAENQAGACFLTCRKRIRFPIKRLLCALLGLFRYDAGSYQSRVDRDRGASGFATLTCHFFRLQPLALGVGSLAIGVIEFRCLACLVCAVGLAALRQSCPMTTDIVMVALTAITGAADTKDDAAFWTSTHSLAYLDFWQGARAFPKAGLDNGRQSWQAMNRSIGWFP